MKTIKLAVIAVLCLFSTFALAQKAPGSPAAVYAAGIAQCAQNNPPITDADGNTVASPARIACDAAVVAAYFASSAASAPARAPAPQAPAKK